MALSPIIDSDEPVKNWGWLVLTPIVVSIDRRRLLFTGDS